MLPIWLHKVIVSSCIDIKTLYNLNIKQKQKIAFDHNLKKSSCTDATKWMAHHTFTLSVIFLFGQYNSSLVYRLLYLSSNADLWCTAGNGKHNHLSLGLS